MKNNFKTQIIEKSRELGLTDIKFTDANVDEKTKQNLKQWIELGYFANMNYIPNNEDKRNNPQLILENVQSIIICSLFYFPGNPPNINEDNYAKISRYAQGKDYHFVMLDKMKNLENYIQEINPQINTKSYTDTGHILEKYFAQKSGIGWQGKNSLIISPKYGSYFFIGVIFTDYLFDYDKPINDYCGTCVRCINACPTGALVQPRVLDSRVCIAYWTVEAKPDEEIPKIVKERNKDWLFGCDICQEVCPYNRKLLDITNVNEFINPDNFYFDLNLINNFTKDNFNQKFAKSPIKRRKYEGFIKNAQNLIDRKQNKSKDGIEDNFR